MIKNDRIVCHVLKRNKKRKEMHERKKERKKRHLSDWPTGVCWKQWNKREPEKSLSLNGHNSMNV